MRSDDYIKSTTIAAIRRSSREIESWTRTTLIDTFPADVKSRDNELPVVYIKCDDDNWTLITTKRIVGQFASSRREVFFEELDDIVWGDYKNTKSDRTVFRTIDMYGDQKDFYMETGYPSMAFVYGVRTIDRLTKSNIIG